MIDIIETVYRGASKGRGLVVSPKGTYYHYDLPLMLIILSYQKITQPATDTEDVPSRR